MFFPIEIDKDDYKDKNHQPKDDFSVNDIIMICHILCIDNFGSFVEIAARKIYCLCDVNT